MAGPAVKHAVPPAAEALAQLDEAFHLLRRRGWLLFYSLFGTMPFGLGLLYFWSDMSRSAFAADRCLAESLLLAVLYVWMKAWQARFMTALYAEATGAADAPWLPQRFLRAAAQQAAIQSTALPVLLVAAMPLLPSAWCVAFYQNAQLYGNGERRTLGEIGRSSWRQARFQPLQNHVLLAVLTLFALFVFLELLWAMLFLPELLRVLTGTETVFTRSGLGILNSTLFAAAGLLCYVALDPLVKAAYVLRCFQSESRGTAADLRLALRRAREQRGAAGHRAALIGLAFLLGTASLSGTVPVAAGPPDSRPVNPAALERAVRRTLQEPRYSWRLPRTRPRDEASRERPRSALGRFLEQLRSWVRRAGLWCRDLLHDVWRWLRRVARVRQPRPSPDPFGGHGWQDAVPYLVVGLTILVVAGLALYAWRTWRRRNAGGIVVADVCAALPDPGDESVTADQRPHDDWLAAARQLVARGELRLGLRAAHLASLALLAERRFLSIARHKSNLDYRRELARRAAQRPEVVHYFDANVSVFDRVWYGSHPASREQIDALLAELERLRAASEP